MIPELGIFSLIIALGFSILLSIIPIVGLWRVNSAWIQTAPRLVVGQFLFVSIAYLCLTIAF